MSNWDAWFIGMVIGALTVYVIVTLVLGVAPHDVLEARRTGRNENGAEPESKEHSGGVP